MMSEANPQLQPPPSAPPIQAPPQRQRPTWLMWAGIGLFVIGVLIVGLGLLRVLPGMAGTGGALAALGVLFFAFSFMRLPAIPDAPPKMSTPATLFGIFFEPTNVFRNLRAHPQWLAAILILGIINAGYTAAFYQRLGADRIVNFKWDAIADGPIKPPPVKLAESRQDELDKESSTTGKIGKAIGGVVAEFFGIAFLAALCLLGVLAFGGRMHYWQAYSVAAYISLPVAVVQKLVSFLVLYLKAPEFIHPILGQESLVYDHLGLLVSSKDHPVIYTFLATFGVIILYRVWLTATGLREGGYKVSSTAGWSVSITLLLLFLVLRLGLALLFPSFLG